MWDAKLQTACVHVTEQVFNRFKGVCTLFHAKFHATGILSWCPRAGPRPGPCAAIVDVLHPIARWVAQKQATGGKASLHRDHPIPCVYCFRCSITIADHHCEPHKGHWLGHIVHLQQHALRGSFMVLYVLPAIRHRFRPSLSFSMPRFRPGTWRHNAGEVWRANSGYYCWILHVFINWISIWSNCKNTT